MKNKLSKPGFKYFHIMLVLTVIVGMCNSAWSAGEKKPSLDKNEENGIEIGKERGFERGTSDIEAREEKGGGSNKVKKKIVKGAGAAAATGFVTKKITSPIKRD